MKREYPIEQEALHYVLRCCVVALFSVIRLHLKVPNLLIIFAGFPATVTLSGTFLVTTEPAPIRESFPIVTGSTTDPAPILAPCLIVVLRSFQSALILGYLSLVKVTCGPIKTSSSILTPDGMKVKGLILTLLPIMTPSSMYTNASIFDPSPI